MTQRVKEMGRYFGFCRFLDSHRESPVPLCFQSDDPAKPLSERNHRLPCSGLASAHRSSGEGQRSCPSDGAAEFPRLRLPFFLSFSRQFERYSWQVGGFVPVLGFVHNGPRFVVALGTLIIAFGPASCSPLNGVGLVTSKPQAAASSGWLNQKPTW